MTIEELEHRLKVDMAVDGPHVKQRVLSAVAAALAEPAPKPAAAWPWIAIAAAAVFALNLGAISASLQRFDPPPGPDAGKITATVQSIQRLLPDLPAAEARRTAMLAAAGATLVAVPDVRSLEGVAR